MKQDGYGRIINVISTSVKQPIDGLGVSPTRCGERSLVGVKQWPTSLGNMALP